MAERWLWKRWLKLGPLGFEAWESQVSPLYDAFGPKCCKSTFVIIGTPRFRRMRNQVVTVDMTFSWQNISSDEIRPLCLSKNRQKGDPLFLVDVSPLCRRFSMSLGMFSLILDSFCGHFCAGGQNIFFGCLWRTNWTNSLLCAFCDCWTYFGLLSLNCMYTQLPFRDLLGVFVGPFWRLFFQFGGPFKNVFRVSGDYLLVRPIPQSE